jgi:hypothetical protein
METIDIIAALRPVVESFNELGITYYIGGSLASSIYGIPRSTLDADLIAAVRKEHVAPLIEKLSDAYYIDRDQIVKAIEKSASFNLIHLATMNKIDVFVLRQTAYDLQAFSRIRRDTFPDDPLAGQYFFASPEDIVINKMQWYRKGGMVSERQWSDILGVLKVQGDGLDLVYVESWIVALQLSELWSRAKKEAGLS